MTYCPNHSASFRDSDCIACQRDDARAKLADAYAALVGYSEGEPSEVLRRLIAQHAIDAAEIARLDGEAAKSRAEIERLRNGFLCPDCGLGVAADEDGCCVTCGLGCFGFENGKATHLYNYVGDCERIAVKSNKLTARLAIIEPVYEAAKYVARLVEAIANGSQSRLALETATERLREATTAAITAEQKEHSDG